MSSRSGAGSPPLERGTPVGAYLLVRHERTADDEQTWLGRTNTMPPAPMTVRLRAGDGGASPYRDEVQLAPWLQHANLFVATEAVTVGPWHCAITAGTPGVPLSELHGALADLRARNEAQWSAVVLHIVGSMLAGLEAAHRAAGAPGHARGIVHASVRPQVVFVGPDGVVRVGGFGAIVDDDPSRLVDRGADAMAYAAPERFGTRMRAPSMDLWAVGAVLHELVDGAPFRGQLTDVRELYRVAMTGEVPALSRPVPELLDRMRQWLLAEQPRARPKSCAEAMAALPPSSMDVVAATGAVVRTSQAASAPAPEAAPMPVHVPVPVPVPAPMPVPPAVYGTPAPMPVAPMPVAPMPVAPMQPDAVPPMFMNFPLDDEGEGTVQIDEAMLAAMRAGTAAPASRTPQPQQPYPQPQQPQQPYPQSQQPYPQSQQPYPQPQQPYPQSQQPYPQSQQPYPQSQQPYPQQQQAPRAIEHVMPPPGSGSASRSAVPAPRHPSPAQPMPMAHPGHAPQPVRAPQPSPPSMVHPSPAPSRAPAPAPSRAPAPAPSRAPAPRHDPGPLELHPSYEPTTTTAMHARRSNRNFILLLFVAAAVAIGVGVSVGYLIVGDASDDTKTKAPKATKEAPSDKDAPSKADPPEPANDGPALQPRGG